MPDDTRNTGHGKGNPGDPPPTPAGGRLRVAVIGAGLAGLTAARILQDRGHDVVVVEKARGPGGRMATRRHETWRFDHGAQYFTARDPLFLRQLASWLERGLVQCWKGRIGVVEDGEIRAVAPGTERFVGVPGMSAVCRDIADELADCRFGWRVQRAVFEGEAWRLRAENGDTLQVEALVVTAPPEQVGPLLGETTVRAAVGHALGGVSMHPCWALLAVLDQPLLVDWDAAFVNGGPLGWVCGQASKPGRPATGTAWVAHATPEWSRIHLECDATEAAERLLGELCKLPGAAGVRVQYAAAHRWRYALARQPLELGALWFGRERLALAGDWCAGSRVEGAFLSGAAAAGHILGGGDAQRVRNDP